MSHATDVARWRTSAVCRAAELPLARLGQWLDRGIITMRGCDVDSNSSGVPRLFSTRRVMQVAITNELARLGIGAGRAAEAALRFTDYPPAGREPCELSTTGRTWLALLPERAEVITVDDPSSFSSDLSILMLPAGAAAVAIVNLNSIVARVSAALQ